MRCWDSRKPGMTIESFDTQIQFHKRALASFAADPATCNRCYPSSLWALQMLFPLPFFFPARSIYILSNPVGSWLAFVQAVYVRILIVHVFKLYHQLHFSFVLFFPLARYLVFSFFFFFQYFGFTFFILFFQDVLLTNILYKVC